MLNIFEKQDVIETRFKKDDKESFDDAISKLNLANIPYVVREERKLTSWLALGYFIYSIILDLFVLGAVIYAFIKWT